ncbi:hypothetical protein ACTWQH_27790 [Streptomyces sp. 6N223]
MCVATVMAGPVLAAWFQPAEDGYGWLRPLVTCLCLGVLSWFVPAIRRSRTIVDAAGIQVRGVLRIRRLP